MQDTDEVNETPEVTLRRLVAYRQTHSRAGHPLGSTQFPDNRVGRRAIQHSWRKYPIVLSADGKPVQS